MTHSWVVVKDNAIDMNYFSYEDHNGPYCNTCRKFFCMYCDEVSILKCISNGLEWSPIGGELANSIINRKGHNE